MVVATAFLLSSCGGGGSSGSGGGGGGGGGGPLYSVPAQVGLTVGDVKQVMAQAIYEAQAQGQPAVIAVTDRVGNVLAVYSMAGANPSAVVAPAPNGTNIDLQGLTIPATQAAIAKAVTGAYLSSGGNAFSTRTASMIVQQHFPPGPASNGLPGGPLFGVQFSQLPCSDLSSRFVSGNTGANAFIGPKRSPLGLSADPGGFPLYKQGVVVGGVGVIGDGVYGFDPNVLDVDNSPEENMALAATFDFAAPGSITADQIFVNGTSLRYSDATKQTLKSNPASAPPFDTLPPGTGSLTAVAGFYDGTVVLPGAIYGTEASGVRKSTTTEFNNADAFILTDGSGNDRYTPRAGTDTGDVASPLTASETQAILEQAFEVMSETRAAIRNPLNSRAEVTMSVVDTHGAVLGIVRAPDAPIFGIDVSLQKARTATFFSDKNAANDLLADASTNSADVQGFVTKVRNFIPDPTALTGKFAFADRSNGDLSRPFFPDGQDGNPNGPFSRPIDQFNPFSTGLQTALVLQNFTGPNPDPGYCTQLPATTSTPNRLQNGIQIFAGSVPIYKNGVLVGGIGVSGDGIDQDDMISFLGLYNAGKQINTVQEAPTAIRADNIVITVNGDQVRLRYVNCPVAPFLNSNDQHPCDGK
jgi:uncharacterized protein GlcG (DUF336 family)